MDMTTPTPRHEVTVRIEKAEGLQAMGKILAGSDVFQAMLGYPTSDLEAIITVRFKRQNEADGLAQALTTAMKATPQWGVRAVIGQAAPEGSTANPHDRTVETIKAALCNLDAGCRQRAILEWAERAETTEVALLVGAMQILGVRRVIENEVRKQIVGAAERQKGGTF